MPDQEDDEQLPVGPLSLEDNGQGVPLSDDEDRPTLGQRIGARPGQFTQPYVAPPPDTAPAAPKIDFDPSKMPPGLMPPASTPQNIPTPPTGSSNPNLVDLAKQQATFGKPIDKNAVDPNTGKPMYKQGIGTKILGTAANFLQGFGRKPFTPVDTSSSATNARYARDEAMREGNLANVNTQIGTQEKMDTENERMYRDAIRQAYEGQIGEARNKLGDAATENAATKATLATTQAALNQARADKLSQDPDDKIGTAGKERTALADKMGLKGTARTDYILTGKLPKEFTDPNAPKRGSKFDFDKIEKDKQKAMKDAEAKAQTSITKLAKPPGPLDPEFKDYIANPQAWRESKKQEIYANLEKEKAQAQSDYEDRIQEKGGSISSPGAAKPAQTPRPTATPAKAPAKPATNKPFANVGDGIKFNGKDTKVTSVRRNPQTDKYAYQIDGKWYTDDELKPAGQ